MFTIKRLRKNVSASHTAAALVRPECKQVTFECHGVLQRKVTAWFDGGKITSDAAVPLLREVDKWPDLRGLSPEYAENCSTMGKAKRVIELGMFYP